MSALPSRLVPSKLNYQRCQPGQCLLILGTALAMGADSRLVGTVLARLPLLVGTKRGSRVAHCSTGACATGCIVKAAQILPAMVIPSLTRFMRLARIVLVASSYRYRLQQMVVYFIYSCYTTKVLRAWWIKPQLILSSLLVLRYVKLVESNCCSDDCISLRCPLYSQLPRRLTPCPSCEKMLSWMSAGQCRRRYVSLRHSSRHC
jgi:hypothetical protein